MNTRRILCDEVAAFLSRYQDNELDQVTRAEIVSHLHLCEACQKKLLQLKEVTTRVKQLPEVETGPYFTARVMGKISEKEIKKRWLSWLPLPSSPSLSGVIYSLVFIIFLVLGVLMNINSNSSTLFSPINGDANQNREQERHMVQVLVESQDLGLINVQDKTIALLFDGSGETHED